MRDTKSFFFYFLSFLKLSCFLAKNEVKPRLWEKDQIVEEMKIKTKDKKRKREKENIPPKNRFEILGHEFTIKKS